MADPGTVVGIGRDVSPREISNHIGGTWESPVSVTGTTGADPRIIPLTKILWVTTNNNDGGSESNNGPGSVSTDGGVTWAAMTDPLDNGAGNSGVMDIAIAVDGRIWACVHDTSNSVWTQTKIYYSDDEMSTWTLSVTNGSGVSSEQSRGWRVLCHPTNANIVAIAMEGSGVGISGSSGGLLHTTDRGDNWSDTWFRDLQNSQNGVQYIYEAVILSNGRVIINHVGKNSPFTTYVHTTDNYGVDWTIANSRNGSSFRQMGLYVSADELTIGFIEKNASAEQFLWLSTDGGDNFSVVSLAIELDDPGSINSFVSTTDAIWVGDFAEDIHKLTPVSSSGVWTKIDAGFPHASTGDDYLGIIPDVLTSNSYTADTEGGIVFSGDAVNVVQNIPPTPDPEDTVVAFHQQSATFKGQPSGAIRRLLRLGGNHG